MLPWFQDKFPVYLAPMAGVSDFVFRNLCKEFGADVLVTEFVSAEGILHRNERTREFLHFKESQRPVGVQLFGADPERLALATREVIDWVSPDFIDINFGCPVNKVVCKNGGSALLKDQPLLKQVAQAVVKAAHPLPVTAKIRIGWSDASINAIENARLLEDSGVQALAIHGRTKEQKYSGQANWEVIYQVADTIRIPVIGNGDIASPQDVLRHQKASNISGVMIGRAAMTSPWIFQETKQFLTHGTTSPPPSLKDRWDLIVRHCELAIENRGCENSAMRFMRGRLMAYSKALPSARVLRTAFSTVASLNELLTIREQHLQTTHLPEELHPHQLISP